MRLLFDSSEQLLKQTLHAIIRDHRFALFLNASKVFDRFIYSLLFDKLLRKKKLLPDSIFLLCTPEDEPSTISDAI